MWGRWRKSTTNWMSYGTATGRHPARHARGRTVPPATEQPAITRASALSTFEASPPVHWPSVARGTPLSSAKTARPVPRASGLWTEERQGLGENHDQRGRCFNAVGTTAHRRLAPSGCREWAAVLSDVLAVFAVARHHLPVCLRLAVAANTRADWPPGYPSAVQLLAAVREQVGTPQGYWLLPTLEFILKVFWRQ
jgi:hypothetical protein